MTSWGAINDREFLPSITVEVVRATHEDGPKKDWDLTVSDPQGTQFPLEVWQKHDPLLDWKTGMKYEIQNAYGQTWNGGSRKKLHSSKKWSAQPVGSAHDARLVVMGDTHVGRETHPKNAYQSIDCARKFKEAVEIAIARGADSIVHTGDVFHDSVSEADCRTVDSAFQLMRDEDIQFYYILGNHECDRGKRLLSRWETEGVAIHLSTDGEETSEGVYLYGYDHRPGSELVVEEMGLPPVLLNSPSILVLHQTLAPFRANANVDLSEICDTSLGSYDYVVSGHLHDPERQQWEGGEFLYAGSTEDLSKNYNASDSSIWVLTVTDGDIDTQRHKV